MMPLYDYKCSHCGHADMEVLPMAATSLQVCPKCEWDCYERQVSLPHTDLKEYGKPIELYSVAMEDLNEIRRFKAKCPDIDLSDDPASEMYGVPIARTRKAKLQALAAAGYQEKT